METGWQNRCGKRVRMNTYKITMTVDRNQLIRFIDTVGLDQNVSIEALPDDGSTPAAPTPVKHDARRGPRGSKVNDAILGALAAGPQSNKQLREALQTAGLATGSLSTGLAILQRQNRVERLGGGLYGLAMKAAAE